MKTVFVGQNILGGLTLQKILQSKITVDLIVTRPDNDYYNLVVDVARQYGFHTEKSQNLNQDESIQKKFNAVRPELGVCCSWGHIIKEPLLCLPTIGWINLHPSFLPEYRGPRPIEWQIFHGKKTVGCTVHFMTRRFDEGNIIFQTRIPISQNDNREAVQFKCGLQLGNLAVQAIKLLSDNPKHHGKVQDSSKASYAPYRDSLRCLQIDKPAVTMINQIRALSPFPLCTIQYNDQAISIASASMTNTEVNANSETLFIADTGKLWVSSKDYYVQIDSIKHKGQIHEDYYSLLEKL